MQIDELTVAVKVEINAEAIKKLQAVESLMTKAKGALNNHGDLLTLRVHKADRYLTEAWQTLHDIFREAKT